MFKYLNYNQDFKTNFQLKKILSNFIIIFKNLL